MNFTFFSGVVGKSGYFWGIAHFQVFFFGHFQNWLFLGDLSKFSVCLVL